MPVVGGYTGGGTTLETPTGSPRSNGTVVERTRATARGKVAVAAAAAPLHLCDFSPGACVKARGFGPALVTNSEPRRRYIKRSVAVVSGFFGQSPCTQISTLGRGGSGLTATVIGVACGVDEAQVWRDVDGMVTADPEPCRFLRLLRGGGGTGPLRGANILHPPGLPVRIKNSYNPSYPGTVIAARRDCGETLVTAITFKKGTELVDIMSTRMLGQYWPFERTVSVVATGRAAGGCAGPSSSSTGDRVRGSIQKRHTMWPRSGPGDVCIHKPHELHSPREIGHPVGFTPGGGQALRCASRRLREASIFVDSGTPSDGRNVDHRWRARRTAKASDRLESARLLLTSRRLRLPQMRRFDVEACQRRSGMGHVFQQWS